VRLARKTAGSNNAKCDTTTAKDTTKDALEIAAVLGAKRKKAEGARGARAVEGAAKKRKKTELSRDRRGRGGVHRTEERVEAAKQTET
jgi:hypothetical protein